MMAIRERLSPYRATSGGHGLSLYDLKAVAEDRLRYVSETAQVSVDHCEDRDEMAAVVAALGATVEALEAVSL